MAGPDWSMPVERRDRARAAERIRRTGAGEWGIADIARLAGTTSRTLRHYDDVGIVKPSRVGDNGYRYYDADALVRLQRVLLLREERIGRQIASVERTISELEGGEQPMAEDMFDGFDHTQYKDEVEERWGKDAYAKSDSWWRSMSAEEKKAWKAGAALLGSDWIEAAGRGIDSAGEEAQALAQRQFDWLRGILGTPGGAGAGPTKEYFTGLAEMYVADERFAVNTAASKARPSCARR
jgi:DNA-binding transcriptional MerR regulator